MKYLPLLLMCCAIQAFGSTVRNSDGSVSYVDDNDSRHWRVTGIDCGNELVDREEHTEIK